MTYEKVFLHLRVSGAPLVLWQLFESGERIISQSLLQAFGRERLSFKLKSETKFDPRLPIYCYAEDGQFIFKTPLYSHASSTLELVLPEEIKVLEESETMIIRGQLGDQAPDYMKVKSLRLNTKQMADRTERDLSYLNSEFEDLTLEEEDRLFASKRSSPRAKPTEEKWVKVQVLGDERIFMLKLYDLSQGGISFITQDNEAFKKDYEIHVLGFDAFDLDDPLIGKIRSLRPVNKMKFEWKVGIKFIEGQS